jgi:hypothetical protein
MFIVSRRSLFLVALFVLFVVTACSRKAPEPEAPAPGPNRGLRPAPAPAAEPRPTQEPAPAPFEFPADPKPAEQAPPAEQQPAPAAEGPPPRDYASELKGLVGSPSGCLKPRAGAQAPREIGVTVEAVVMESGLISRAYARSGELDDDELACIRARLGSARMQSGVEDAPRTVTTSVNVVLQPAATRVPAAPGEGDQNAPGEQPPAEGQQPEPGSAPSNGAEQAPGAPPTEAPPPAYGQPEAPANNPE